MKKPNLSSLFKYPITEEIFAILRSTTWLSLYFEASKSLVFI